MGFWWFMFFMDLLIPLTMIGFGRYFINHAPGNINMVFGYRTGMSMKNKATWEFAHHYFGRIWFWCGVIIAGISVIIMLFLIGKGKEMIGNAGLILCYVQVACLIGTIIPTERALRKKFDKEGQIRF